MIDLPSEFLPNANFGGGGGDGDEHKQYFITSCHVTSRDVFIGHMTLTRFEVRFRLGSGARRQPQGWNTTGQPTVGNRFTLINSSDHHYCRVIITFLSRNIPREAVAEILSLA